MLAENIRAPACFDWKNPDYTAVLKQRLERLQKIRATPQHLPALRLHYQNHIAQFLDDWAVTVDPRVAAKGRSAFMPLKLFPKQVELVNWFIALWKSGEPGVLVKARDIGASWLAMATACSLCVFHKNMMVGIGSAKEDKLDRSGDPDTLFYKGRQFLANLPQEFRGGFDVTKNSAHLRIIIPETGSSITGEAGDQIGRGGRKAIFFLDESAHIPRPQLIDAALATATDCRIDMSSVNGSANSFAERARSGKIKRFDFGWRDDPRKDGRWYAQKASELDPVTLAQEIDCNFAASAEGLLIPSNWVQSAIGAHRNLGIEPTGMKYSGFDVADAGANRCALAARHGILLERLQSWSGQGGDLYRSTVRAFSLLDEWGYAQDSFMYDSDGLGAGIRGCADRINEDRTAAHRGRVRVQAFRGSGAVWNPRDQMVKGSVNEDYFLNLKAQSWWALRMRFEQTWRAMQGLPYQREELISINPNLPELTALVLELSQPTYARTASGKLTIDKVPDGARSPDLADSVMIAFAPSTRTMEMWIKLGKP